MNWVKRNDLTTLKQVVLTNAKLTEEEFFSEKPYKIMYAKAFWNIVLNAINQKKKITIVGDYDCDGITSSSQLYLALKELNADVHVYLPKRFTDGFGLSPKIIDTIDSGLVITVDNGIVAHEAVKKANEKGLQVIITDHHQPNDSSSLPDADLIINPHALKGSADFSDYCGAGIVFKLISEYFDESSSLVSKCIGLAAIGTIADVMPLIKDNRNIVKKGLKMMATRERTDGIYALLEELNLKNHIEASDVGYRIGPCLNAPGRLYDDGATKSFHLLTCNEIFKARELTKIAIADNEKRKKLSKDNLEKIEQNIIQNRLTGSNPLIVFEPNVPEGIVGILAGNLTEKYKVPSIVFTSLEHNPDLIKGSGRSPEEYNLKELLDKTNKLCPIYKYGGHAGAAGITIEKEKLSEFIKAMKQITPSKKEDTNTLYYDLEISVEDIKSMLVTLEEYAPFGEGNPAPIFLIKNYTLYPKMGKFNKIMGEDGTHIKLFGKNSDALLFDRAKEYVEMGEPKAINLIGTLSYNYFNEAKTPQVEIIDFTPAKTMIKKSLVASRLQELAQKRYQ